MPQFLTSFAPRFWPRAPDHLCFNARLLHPQHKPIGHCWFSTSYTMGIWDTFSEIVEAVTPWSVVEAEAPAAAPQVSRFGNPL